MNTSHPASRWLVSSAVTTAATTGALLLLAARESGHPASALNATSHILWGERSTRRDGWSLRYTLVGAVLNAGAMGSWAFVQQLLPRPRSVWVAARNATLVTGLAYVTDYAVVPHRLNPGFEQRLSKPALFTAYAVLAGALAVGALLGRRRHE